MGYEQLKNILDANKEELEKTKQERDNPTSICPDCGWRLMISTDGQKACSICGAIWR